MALEVFRRDDYVKVLTFTETGSGDPIPITGSTIIFSVKEDMEDSDDDALIRKVITDHSYPTDTNKTLLNIPKEETNIEPGTYHYDIQYTNSLGRRKTIIKGRFKIKQDVTHDDLS